MSSNYWSSTTNANNNDNAWRVNFNNGNVNNNNKSNTYYVRAVRSGKCSLHSFESVYRAYLDCRKRKRCTINALRFEYNLIDNLFNLTLALQKGTYQPSRSVCFITTTPKLREIFAADFADRIVHHLIVRELEKILEPGFIYDSYASRKGKGTHAAVKRLQGFMLKVTRNKNLPAYFLKLDIRSFFMSIDKNILFGIFERVLTEKVHPEYNALLYLINRVIFHNCVDDYVFKGDPAILDKMPPHKTLFKMPPEKGLPIGNLTSRFFANVYLNVLDRFIKHTIKCPFYMRYVDDLILLSQKKEELIVWEEEIEAFLMERLALHIKPQIEIKRCHFRHAATFNLINTLFIKQAWLKEYFIYYIKRIFGCFKHKGSFPSLYAQVNFFKHRLTDTILFVKVGRYFVVYNEDALFIAPSLKLAIKEDFRGMSYAVGFPVWLKAGYLSSALSLKRDVAIIYEGMQGRLLKDRYVREIYRITHDESRANAHP